MGSDCKAYIKPIAKLEDILQVAAILLGSEKIFTSNNNDGETYETVDLAKGSLKVKPSSIGNTDSNGFVENFDNFLTVVVKSEFDLNNVENMFFMQPHANSQGELYFSGRSNPKICALSLKLIEIFGGTIFPDDQDDAPSNEVKEGSWNKLWTDNEDKGFVEKHQYFKNLQFLNKEDLYKGYAIAAYKDIELFQKILDNFKALDTLALNNKLEKNIEEKNSTALSKKLKI